MVEESIITKATLMQAFTSQSLVRMMVNIASESKVATYVIVHAPQARSFQEKRGARVRQSGTTLKTNIPENDCLPTSMYAFH